MPSMQNAAHTAAYPQDQQHTKAHSNQQDKPLTNSPATSAITPEQKIRQRINRPIDVEQGRIGVEVGG